MVCFNDLLFMFVVFFFRGEVVFYISKFYILYAHKVREGLSNDLLQYVPKKSVRAQTKKIQVQEY